MKFNMKMNMKDVKNELKKIGDNAKISSKNGKNDSNVEKRKMKQRDKGVLMILASIILGYISFSFLLTPVNDKKLSIEIKQNEVATKRSDLELELENKVNTQNEINKLEVQIEGYSNKFPNTRTRNEILVVLNSILSGYDKKLGSLEVANTAPLSKGEVGTSIQNKGIAGSMKEASYFVGSIEKDPNANQGNEQANQENPTAAPFDSTLATIKVSDLSYSEAYAFIEKIYKTERLVVPKALNVVKGDGSKYSIEGDLIFYSYRNIDPIDLF